MNRLSHIGLIGTVLLAGANYVCATQQSVTLLQNVAKAKVHISATGPSSAVAPGSSVTVSAHVEGNNAAVPTGTVNFTAKPATGHDVSSTVAVDKNGIAQWTAGLSSGSYSVTATYEGDENYLNDSTSVPVTVSGPDFKVGVSNPTTTIDAGGSANMNLDVGALDGFTGKVTFSCSGLGKGMACSFKPDSVQVGSGVSKVSLSISTNTATSVAALGSLFFLGLVGIRRRKRPGGWFIGCLFLSVVLGLSGCAAVHFTPSVTPAGTYEIVVTATSGNLSHSQIITVVVK